jgi:tetratricopeptide (TPR) repeat protein
LVLLTAAVYAPVGYAAFLSYDDIDYVVDNPYVNAGLTRDGLVWAWTGVHQATWHPLTSLSHMLDCQLFGLNPGPQHLGNVVLHLLNTLLLFGVLARMTAQPWRSAWVAGLFALHPLHVESVAWISERKDVLSTFFWMLTLWSYVGYVRRPGMGRYFLVLAAYVAALLSKPMVVTLPFVLLLLDVWPLGRWGGAAARGSGGAEARFPARPLPGTSLVLEKLPLMLLAAAVSAITFIAQQRAAAVVPLATSPFVDRAANAVVVYVGYLRQMLWPAGLAVFYPFEASLPGWKIVGAALVLAGVTVLVLRGMRRYPYLLVGWLWYLGMLVPVIGFVRIGDYGMADRYTYVPLVGIFIIAAWGVPDLLAGWTLRQPACVLGATVALASCTLLTARQVQFWQNSLTLFEHALAVTPNNYVAHVNVGMALAEQGKDDQAFEQLSEAVRVKPSYPVAQYALGLILDKRGDRNAAKEHFLTTLSLDPSYSQAHNRVGMILAAAGDLDGAVAQYRAALQLTPDLPDAHDNLGAALDALGQRDAALAEYAEGVRLAPQRAEAQCTLAEALGRAGRFQEAATHFRLAVPMDPHSLRARYGLALAQAKAGQVREAVAEFDALLREQPNWPAVEVMLAWLLATPDDPRLRDGPRATRLAEDAVQRTNHQNPDALNSLAAAYAESGRLTDAVETAEAALELAQASGRSALAGALADRLAQYRAGQPARDLARGMQR